MKLSHIVFFVALIAMVSVGCTASNSTKANEWVNDLTEGMTKDEVEASKPDFVTVYWDMAIPVDSITVEYDVAYKDAGFMSPTSYYLIFRKGVYSHYSEEN